MALDGWRLTLSGCHDWVDETENRLTGTTTSLDERAFIGWGGILYAFDNGLSSYASYSTSFKPEMGTNAAGGPFDPTEGEQVEVGVKGQIPGTESLLSVAARSPALRCASLAAD